MYQICCETHLSIVLIAKKEFACTDVEGPENMTVVYSDGKKETFCKGCIKHYLKIMYNYFVFVDFNLNVLKSFQPFCKKKQLVTVSLKHKKFLYI